MKYLLIFIISMINFKLSSSNYEVEFFFALDANNQEKMEFSNVVTLRQFHGKANWKDNNGEYGVVECMGNHTVVKNKKTILRMYCKEENKNNDNFVIKFDRDSEHYDVGVGESIYISAIGKYKKYKDMKCIYAVNLFEGKGSIIKQKCKLNDK